MPLWKNYFLAESLPYALKKLSSGARLVAGGTDLLIEVQQGVTPPVENLVDVTRIPELNTLEIRGQDLFIGAAVSLNRIVDSPLVQEHAQALIEACNMIAGPQVRNTATLGGNVAHALPAADGTIALLALRSVAEAVSIDGLRKTPIEDLFLGPRESALKANNEILVGFYIPLRKSGQSSAFNRVMRPQGVALPILNLAVWMQREGNLITDVQLAIGPSGPVPIRARAAESFLRGKEINKDNCHQAFQALFEDVRLRTSPYRASQEYRRHLALILMEDVLEVAWHRAKQANVI